MCGALGGGLPSPWISQPVALNKVCAYLLINFYVRQWWIQLFYIFSFLSFSFWNHCRTRRHCKHVESHVPFTQLSSVMTSYKTTTQYQNQGPYTNTVLLPRPQALLRSHRFYPHSSLCVCCGTPGLPVPHHLPEFVQVHVHWIDVGI